ncbi:MAG: MarR family transcriptional regulator, partial [Defluviitaleaceae bacterium]|nr:MarR family transcriptional regulator [Defluviitaleaceae bacterium]
MPETLTTKQKLILDFLKAEIRQNGFPPTVREICDAVGLSSTSTVHAHLETLERKGFIRRSPTKNRSTEILEDEFYTNTRGLFNV